MLRDYIEADSVLTDASIDRIWSFFSSLFGPEAPPAGTSIELSFSVLLSMVRNPYNRELEKDRNDARLALEKKNSDLQVTQQQLQASQQQLQASQQQLQASQQQLQASQQQLQASQQQLQATQQQLQATHQQLGNCREAEARLAGALDAAQRTLELKQTRNKRLKDELSKEREGKAKLEGQLTKTTELHTSESELVKELRQIIGRIWTTNLSRPAADSNEDMTGSRTRASMWQHQRDVEGNEFSASLLRLPLPLANDAEFLSTCEPLASTRFPKESAMYEPFTNFLREYLRGSGFLVFDTHKHYYLDTFAPDITISLPGVAVADAMAMVLFFELKAQGTTLGTDHDLGQVYEYLLAAGRCQRDRTRFVGILSDIDVNIAVVLSRSGTNNHLTQYAGATFPDTLRFVNMVLNDPSYHPPTLGFSQQLGPMFSRLGRPSRSIVGVFGYTESFPPGAEFDRARAAQAAAPPAAPPTRMAVKRSKPQYNDVLRAEIRVLLTICDAGGHPNLPCLTYLSPDLEEIGLLPIGGSLSSTSFKLPDIGSILVSNIIAALVFLHNHKIIHRDVRADNIILYGAKAVLVDFDCATTSGHATTYKGGYICTPDDVLASPHDTYIPVPKHDYLAFLLMVNALLFPHAYKGFRSNMVIDAASDETMRLVQCWTALRESRVWGPWVVAAEQERVGTLEDGLKDLMVML